MRGALFRFAAAAAVAAVGGGCALLVVLALGIRPRASPAPAREEAPGAGAPNVLANGSFERGREPWFDLAHHRPYWHGFEVVEAPGAPDGAHAARLRVTAPAARATVAIHGVVQDLAPLPGDALPETLSGWYRVERWNRRVPKQYVQAVVIADERLANGEILGRQLRYVLSGIRERPFEMPVASFFFLGPEEPETGRWLRFERDLRRDWAEAWGAPPGPIDAIRVLFEARFDGREATEPADLAEVLWDDLYMGPHRPPAPPR